jgi:hypothetical protein
MRCINEKDLILLCYNELTPVKEQEVRNHLEKCTECQHLYSSFKQTIFFAGKKKISDPGEKFWRDFPRAVFAKIEKSSPWKVFWQDLRETVFVSPMKPIFATAGVMTMVLMMSGYFYLASLPTMEEIEIAKNLDLLMNYDRIENIDLLNKM